MAPNDPVPPDVRLAISQWPDDAPRGAVTAFCTDHNISRKTFYKILNTARTEGQSAALTPKSRRPHTTPTTLPEHIATAALAVHADLDAAGWDCGPISVHDRMITLGLSAPSTASLARLFRRRGFSAEQPQKKPRTAYRRFRAPAPNALWQIDATGYVLTGGRPCTIFQLIDDHSRLALASLVTTGETSFGALTVVKTAIGRYGVPQQFLSDNGNALNPTRRGRRGQLVDYLRSLGVTPITSLPAHPTTQGKNERFHQTLFRWLGRKPLAGSIDELQELVDEFDKLYNTERPHQGLPDRMTPQQAWDALPVAEPPRPEPVSVPIDDTPTPVSAAALIPEPRAVAATGSTTRHVDSRYRVRIRGISFRLPAGTPDKVVTVAWDEEGVTVTTAEGDFIIEHAWPPPGVTYVGTGRGGGRPRADGDRRARGRSPEKGRAGEVSPMS
jgi:putative transposase